MGKHPVPCRSYAAIHLLRHERIRAFRTGSVLVARVLDVDLRVSRRGLDRVLSPRRRRFFRRPNTPRHRTGSAADPCLRALLLVAVGSGVWYYYNAHVLNEYLTAKDRRQIQAAYERDFRKYELLPQPKVTAVEASVNIYPERRSFDGTGRFTLQNKSAEPLSQVHITDLQKSVSKVQFDRSFKLLSTAPRNLYSVYSIDPPLQPGEVMTMTFSVGHESRGFRDGNEPAEFAYNGTFFDAGYFPAIGYQRDVELNDPRRRREEHLGPLEEMAPRGDAVWGKKNLFNPNSDWITFRTIVSTSGDQVAIAPVTLCARGKRTDADITSTAWVLPIFRTSMRNLRPVCDPQGDV